ncbi:hypothetical protein Pla108_18500 [Botrimarina colliarenosi]|uniref:Sialidase domain-containing protein n=1 Tax=Botrimarina colliarenosi TaxID=2528001 RepID=A0A5C6AEF9_9BACT|nr:sialidase family protein [Botrimarina colliarenosi]TWT97698.1 hypothetical protein Pla108_18500 [Botrimarina colliarenosi]
MAGQGASGPVIRSEFINPDAPYPSCHASTLAETDDGVVAAWFGGTHERHPDVGIWVARCVEGVWQAPVEVANGVVEGEREPTWNPVLFQPSSGPLLLFYKVGPTPQSWWGMLTTSADGGRTWSTPRRLPDGVIGPVKNKPIELANGDLLCPSSTEDHGWRVHFERTNDLGKTWRVGDPVNDPDAIRAIQPSLLRHGDRRLQAIGRTQKSGLFQVWSEDLGRTWGEMTTTGLPNPNSGTDAVTLADGRQLLVYNHSTRDHGPHPKTKGRSPLNVSVSDDGVAWEAALVLENDYEHPAGYAYPAVIQTSDGLVHITYTWRREQIKHVVIDPDRLTTRPIVDAQWPSETGNVE